MAAYELPESSVLRRRASDHVSGDRPDAAGPVMMAAGRRLTGRDYVWRGARRSIFRSGDIAVRNTPAAARCVRAVVTSEGSGGAGGFGGAVPLRDGRGPVVAGPGSGRGAGGSGTIFPLAGGARRSVLGDRWLAVGRNAATEDGRPSGRPLADAQQRRRQLPTAAAQGGRYRADPVAGAGECTQAEPPAASLPLLCDGMTSGSARPGPSRATCGLEVAGIHRVTAAARPGSARQLPSGTGIPSRNAASRASWAPTIVMTASVRICSSGSPG
jgi:hypothetical protein